MHTNQRKTKLAPDTPRKKAMEVLADLYRRLDDHEGSAWLKDIRKGSRAVATEIKDPWK